MSLITMPFDVVNNLLSHMSYQDHVILSLLLMERIPDWKQIIDKEAPKKISLKNMEQFAHLRLLCLKQREK